MKSFLSETDTLLAIRKYCRKAKGIKAALALITRSGLHQVEKELEQLLVRGGEVQVLLGVDMATEPEAIEELLALEQHYADRMAIRRFVTETMQTFHPKAWIFSFQSGPAVAIVGSSNLTAGGLGRNYEANVRVDAARVVGEIEEFFDELFEGGRAKHIDMLWRESYRELWKQQRAARMKIDRLQNGVKLIRTRRAVRTTAPTRIREHSFAFTGGIAGWPRELKLYPTVKKYGGNVLEVEGLKKAECLVHGDIRGGRQTTRKLRAARRDGIDIISQSDFFRIPMKCAYESGTDPFDQRNVERKGERDRLIGCRRPPLLPGERAAAPASPRPFAPARAIRAGPARRSGTFAAGVVWPRVPT